MFKQRMIGRAMLAALVLKACAADAASPEHGKTVFMKMGCWQSHGTIGQGGNGTRIAPESLPSDTLDAFVCTTSHAMPPELASIR